MDQCRQVMAPMLDSRGPAAQRKCGDHGGVVGRPVVVLGIRPGPGLLDLAHVHDREGRPVEWSDDRYRSDAVSFSVHNSIDNNALARKTAE